MADETPRRRFYPACPVCVDVGHRNVVHPAAPGLPAASGLREALDEAVARIDLYPTHDAACPAGWVPAGLPPPRPCRCSHAKLLARLRAAADTDLGAAYLELQERFIAFGDEVGAAADRAERGLPLPDIETRIDDIVERYGGALDALAERGLPLDVERLRNAMTRHLIAWQEPDGSFKRGHARCNEACVPELAAEYARLAADPQSPTGEEDG